MRNFLALPIVILALLSCSPRKPAAATSRLGLEGTVALPVTTPDRIVICGNASIPRLAPTDENNPRFMPFWLEHAESARGIKAGDSVRFDLRVDWASDRPVLITAIRKLSTSLTGGGAETCQDDHPPAVPR